MIKIGNLTIDKFYLGDSSDVKIYLGDVKVWPEDVPPTPTLQWVSYSEGDAIPNEGVYKIYGFKIPTQTLLDIIRNGNYLEIDLNSEEKDQLQHPVSFIEFALYSEGFFLTINGKSQEISYDPESDEYLEIIFSDYGVNYNYDISYFTYGEEGDTSQVYNFPFDMDLYQEYVPTGSTCYEIISTPITSYASTTYSSVYSFADLKWYMLNNLNGYEEYGVYDIVEDIASATTYDGKLAVVGTTEYQYSGGSWSVVGTYEDASVTYEIDGTNPSPYVGQELSTTFKIPYADIETISWVDLSIRDNNDGELQIRLDTGGWAAYRYKGSERYEGTVTNDDEYFYLSLPSEAPQSIVIESISYRNSTPIHLIFGSKQISVEYVEKDIPLGNVYDTVAEMETAGCPTVGVNEYGVVGNDAYQFDGEDWNSVSNYKLMEKNADGKANVLLCSSSTILSKTETQPSYFNNITDVVIGYCITYIGDSSFYDCSSLSSIDIPNGVTNIGGWAFANCNSLTSIDIPNSVTNIGAGAFQGCSSLSSITIPSGVTSIGNAAFSNCSRLTSIVIPNSVTTINNKTFYGCSSLTSIDIPNGVTSIGQSVFSYCSSLTSIDIPNGVTSIGQSAFSYCSSLTSIDIPSGVTSISYHAFENCSGLTSITVNATTPPKLANANAFSSTNNCPIYVPDASVSAYKSANNWKTYASRIKSISSK